MEQRYSIALKAGLYCGAVLAVAEVAFGAALFFLRPAMSEFIAGGYQDFSVLVPLSTVWIALLFLVLSIYFACGMITAKWLAPLPLRSQDIAALGALAGAVAEVVRSLVAVVINFALSLMSPLAGTGGSGALNTALETAGLRLACGLPVFVVVAAIVAGVSAYLFSIIFFRPENMPR